MTIKELPHQARELEGVEIQSRDGAFTFSASSEAPVERYFGTETLDHREGAVDMGRINSGAAPLLFNHNWDDPIGMVDGGEIRDGRLEVSATLFKTDRAREVEAMIDGGLRNVSIGYQINEMVERSPGDYLVTNFEPHEVSIVTVPADFSVGLGRLEDQVKPVRVIRAKSETAQTAEAMEDDMSDQKTAPAAETAEIEITREAQRHDPVQAEKTRQKAINNLGEASGIDRDTIQDWIATGADLERVSEDIVAIQKERHSAANSAAILDLSPKEVKRYSVIRAINATLSNNWHKAGLELECHKTLQDRSNQDTHEPTSFFVPRDVQVSRNSYAQRDFNVAGAGNLVGTDHMGSAFIDLLRNASVVFSSGATVMSGLRGNVAIPKMTAGSTAYWLANETTAITESQPTIGQVTLSPKNVAALTEVSHQMLQQGDPSAEAIVMNDLASSVALAADIGALRGDDTGGDPLGIIETPNIGAFTGTSLDYAAVLNAQEDIVAANADRLGSIAYVCDPATATKLKTRVKFAGTDSPIWTGDYRNGTCADIPARATNQMAANTMLLGAWSALIIGEWGTLELAVNPAQNFAAGTIGLRAWYTMDAAVRYPGAFSYAASIT
jgi:HK97 family phage major capsid protein/HK97 family phage prohead protease